MKNYKGLYKLALVAIFGLGLSACAGTKNSNSEGSTNHASNDQSWGQSRDVQTAGVEDGQNFYSENEYSNEDFQDDLLTGRTYHFGFDRFEIEQKDIPAMEAHARYLRGNPDKVVRIEGHTDERGSREYNVALGERRAKSVLRYFQAHGVQPNQIKVVSYGQEKPASFGHDESAYGENRRAVVVYE